MSGKKERSKPVAARSAVHYTIDTLISGMPNLDKLFVNLASGGQFNFLDIMAGISEMVAFYTDYDIPEGDLCEKIFVMSGKKCRNCY